MFLDINGLYMRLYGPKLSVNDIYSLASFNFKPATKQFQICRFGEMGSSSE